MEDKHIRVLVVHPNQLPTIEYLPADASLAAMQKIVDGYIEMVRVRGDNNGDLDVVMNEEGRVHGLPLVGYVTDENGNTWDVYGTFFFVRIDDEGSSASITDEDIVWIKQALARVPTPETHA